MTKLLIVNQLELNFKFFIKIFIKINILIENLKKLKFYYIDKHFLNRNKQVFIKFFIIVEVI